MSTRSTTHFQWKVGDDLVTNAIVYRHYDGYVEGHGADLIRFFVMLEDEVSDTRFGDPDYLAAKLVVYLAAMFRRDNGHYLDFLGVGVTLTDPGDIEYRYLVNCSDLGSTIQERHAPMVQVEERRWRSNGETEWVQLGELRDVLRNTKFASAANRAGMTSVMARSRSWEQVQLDKLVE